MRRRFIQDSATGRLVETKVCPRPDHSKTYQVGDLPDMKKDLDRRKAEEQRAYNRDRKQRLIEVVNGDYR